MIRTLAAVVAAASLAACVSPTPYRAANTNGTPFGYASTKLTDQLYRVRFLGTRRTPARWIDAFLLYRSAELAQEAKAPAFKIVEGTVDLGILDGEEIFGRVDLDAQVSVTALATRPTEGGDVVVGSRAASANMQRTAGAMPVFRMPPPPLRIPSPAPVYIYTPGYAAPALADRSVMIELHSDLKDMDEKTFVTADVLQKLAPRIKRPVSSETTPATTPPTSL